MFGNQALTIGNLVSHSHERLKTKDETKEMEEELSSECFALFRALADQLPPKSIVLTLL